MPMSKMIKDQATEVDVDPYSTAIINVLEQDIKALVNDLDLHTTMAKSTKGDNIHKRMLRAKKRNLDRLLSIHPEGEGFLFQL